MDLPKALSFSRNLTAEYLICCPAAVLGVAFVGVLCLATNFFIVTDF